MSFVRELCLRALVLLLSFPLTLSAFGQTDEDVAMQFYPPSLDEFFINTHAPGRPVVRETTLLRLDLTGSGVENELAVAYSNGLAAELFLFRGSGAQVVLLGQADDAPGGRGKPVLQAVDIENDGIPELEVGFLRETWLYKFNGTALVPYGPPNAPENGHVASLGTVTYFDVDGDGTLEILEADGSASEAAYIVHKLQGSRFAPTSTEVAFFDRFEEVEGLATKERDFTAAPGNYSLQVIDVLPPAEEDAGAPVQEISGGPQVTLNGEVVYGGTGITALDLSGETGIPVTLASENALSVELPAEPDHFIYILMTRTR